MSYTVEKGLPIPGRVRRKSKYPFAEMEIGDSFAFVREDLLKIEAAARAYTRRYLSKFHVSTSHLRVWRTE